VVSMVTESGRRSPLLPWWSPLNVNFDMALMPVMALAKAAILW
jgi:hypothetical protein